MLLKHLRVSPNAFKAVFFKFCSYIFRFFSVNFNIFKGIKLLIKNAVVVFTNNNGFCCSISFTFEVFRALIVEQNWLFFFVLKPINSSIVKVSEVSVSNLPSTYMFFRLISFALIGRFRKDKHNVFSCNLNKLSPRFSKPLQFNTNEWHFF